MAALKQYLNREVSSQLLQQCGRSMAHTASTAVSLAQLQLVDRSCQILFSASDKSSKAKTYCQRYKGYDILPGHKTRYVSKSSRVSHSRSLPTFKRLGHNTDFTTARQGDKGLVVRLDYKATFKCFFGTRRIIWCRFKKITLCTFF